MRNSLPVLMLLAYQAVAQEQPHNLTPIAGDGQKLRGAAAINDGAVGVDARKTAGGFKVASVAPASPAEKSGIRIGDLITAIDEQSLASVGQNDFYRLLGKKPGETVHIYCTRSGQPLQIAVPVESRGKVYPEEGKLPPGVSQYLFDGHAAVTVGVSQTPAQPQSVMVWLWLSNIDAPLVPVDDSKFFVLDGQGQQLRHMSLEEIKYSIQSSVAQNLRGGNYPPPPPPQHHYVITGTQNGNYTFGEAGNMGTLSGNSSSTYTVHDQPDYTVSGWYTLGSALRQRADRKHNEQIMQQAQAALSQWDALYFKSQSPVIPGENRGGGIVYWTGSARQAAGPFKVVLFLNDPTTGKQEITGFEFR